MADTTFVAGTTITHSWLNDVNAFVYHNIPYTQKIYASSFVQAGDTEYGVAVTRAILYALTTYGGGVIEFPAGGAITITSKILIPSGIYINLNGCNITGGGTGYATAMFETAYYSGGTLITNIGTPAQSHQVLNAGVIGNGATIQNAGTVLNLQDTHDVCAFGGISFSNCTTCVRGQYVFYSSFFKMTSRGNAGGATNAAFWFTGFDNVMRTDEIFVVGRVLAYQFDGGGYGLKIVGCSAEQCTTGMLFIDTINSLQLRSCYFENNTTAIQMNGSGSSFLGVDIDDNWFNLNATAILAINFKGRWGSNNILTANNTNTVNFSDSTCYATVEIPITAIADSAASVALPSAYNLGTNCVVSHILQVYNSSSGAVQFRAQDPGPNIIPLPFFGDSGDPETNNIAFCTTSSSNPGGTPFNVIVDTNIPFRNYGMLVGYSLLITDNAGSYNLFGIVFGGTNVKQLDVTTKTVSASNQGGKLRLTFTSFSHPTGLYSATGVVRHL